MRRLLMLLTAAIAVVVGCAAPPLAGEAYPTDGRAAQSNGISLPARPREIRLDDTDPCTLLTPTQRSKLGITSEPLPGTTDTSFFTGPTCSMAGFEPREIGVGIALSTESSINELLNPGTLRDEVSPITVAGFPAIVSKSKLIDFCAVDIDVAEGQFVDIQFHDAGKNPPIPQEQLCRDAAQVAEAVMQTLQGA